MLDDLRFWQSMREALEQKVKENVDNPDISACEMQSCINLIKYCRKRIGAIMADKLTGDQNADVGSSAGHLGP